MAALKTEGWKTRHMANARRKAIASVEGL